MSTLIHSIHIYLKKNVCKEPHKPKSQWDSFRARNKSIIHMKKTLSWIIKITSNALIRSKLLEWSIFFKVRDKPESGLLYIRPIIKFSISLPDIRPTGYKKAWYPIFGWMLPTDKYEM